MANFSKFTKAQKSAIMRHNERGNKNYSNKNIDKERTKDNYQLGPQREDTLKYANDRIEQSQHLTRANIVQMVGFTLTLPKDYDGNDREFFSNVYEFIERDFGRDNIIGAYVHMDEKSPHIHIELLPITEDNRLCAKDIINRDYLQHFHDRLQEYLREKDPQHTINILREEKEKEPNIPMREYKLNKELKELDEREKELEDRKKAHDINKAYNGLIDKYCEEHSLTVHQYYREVFMADRGYSHTMPIPEALNPERTKEERDQIIEDYKQAREEHTRDRNDRDDRER